MKQSAKKITKIHVVDMHEKNYILRLNKVVTGQQYLSIPEQCPLTLSTKEQANANLLLRSTYDIPK